MANNSNGNELVSPLLEYGITKAVLQSLSNIQQLNKAAIVCKSWNETAKIIKKSRHQIYCTSNSECYEDCTCVQSLISVMRSQPCLCVVFLTHEGLADIPPPLPEFNIDQHSGLHKGRCTEYRLLHYLKKKLPLNCAIVGGIANGVVTSNESLQTNEIEDGDGYGLIFIPDIPDLTIRNFHLDKQKIKKIAKAITSQPDEVGQLLNIKDDDKVQCLIFLGTDAYKESKCIEAICRYFQDKRNQNIAIGGGFVEAAIHPDVVDGDRDYGITGLVFCGTEVRASSVVVPPDVTTDSDIERIILQMKENHDSSPGQKRRSIGFMVACVARGTHLHGQTGVESAIFRRHFPTTPLLGFFGNGEIGVNCLGPMSPSTTNPHPFQTNVPSAPKKSRTTYLHSYATAFTLVSFPVE